MTEKKRFEKAISQLDSAFQKAKEVKSTTVDVSAEDKNLSKELNATRKTTLDNLFDKQKSELKLEIPSKNRFQKTNPNALISEVDILKKQPDLEIKKVPYLKKTFQRLQNLRETSKETDKKETVPFDNSFDSAIEKLARKKQRVPDTKTAGIKPIELKESQKTEPKKEVKILPHEPIDDKKKWQQNLEDSLYLALHKILQKQTPLDSSLPEEFYKDSKMVLKNRTFLKERFSHFSDVKIDFYVQLGEMDIVLGDLLDFKEGTILETEIAPSTKLNCYANKQLLGRGELVFEDYTAGFKLNSFTE